VTHQPEVGGAPGADADGLTLERRTVGHRTVISLGGEIDLATVGRLRAAIADALEEGAHELWIDLSALVFMDSAGIHALFEVHERMAELNRRFAIVCPPGPVARLLEMTAVTTLMPVYQDRAAAQRGG
jgi:anti-anti-sigma factor